MDLLLSKEFVYQCSVGGRILIPCLSVPEIDCEEIKRVNNFTSCGLESQNVINKVRNSRVRYTSKACKLQIFLL